MFEGRTIENLIFLTLLRKSKFWQIWKTKLEHLGGSNEKMKIEKMEKLDLLKSVKKNISTFGSSNNHFIYFSLCFLRFLFDCLMLRIQTLGCLKCPSNIRQISETVTTRRRTKACVPSRGATNSKRVLSEVTNWATASFKPSRIKMGKIK